MEVRCEKRRLPLLRSFLSRTVSYCVFCNPMGDLLAGTTNDCEIRVEIIFILGSHDLVQVICSRPARRYLLILLKNSDVRVSAVGQFESGR